jgi:hypothetical protein
MSLKNNFRPAKNAINVVPARNILSTSNRYDRITVKGARPVDITAFNEKDYDPVFRVIGLSPQSGTLKPGGDNPGNKMESV